MVENYVSGICQKFQSQSYPKIDNDVQIDNFMLLH